ncbi:MAG: metal-dependent hydrolase [Rhodothermales bacterium]|nr:metal-dependent hydrolase [Rhodothermales bacterium]
MKLTYFGHSAFQLDIGDATILLDPFITGNPHAEGIVTADELEPDVILLTHAHGDHWGDTPSIAKRTGALVVSNFEITNYLTREHGHENVQSMNTGGWLAFPWGRIQYTWARHSSSFPDGTYGGNPGGFIIHAEDTCIYAAGDTSPFAEMEWMGDRHDIHLALLPVGDCFTMGPEDSIHAANMLGANVTVPIHYNTFPPIEIDIDAWAVRMDEAGRVHRVMRPGENVTL